MSALRVNLHYDLSKGWTLAFKTLLSSHRAGGWAGARLRLGAWLEGVRSGRALKNGSSRSFCAGFGRSHREISVSYWI